MHRKEELCVCVFHLNSDLISATSHLVSNSSKLLEEKKHYQAEAVKEQHVEPLAWASWLFGCHKKHHKIQILPVLTK